MGFVGALRFAASIMGIGRAPWVVDQWSPTIRNDRKEIRSAIWLTVVLVPFIALFCFIVRGWGYLFPAALTALWLGLVWDYTLHRKTLIAYYRSFRKQYLATGKDDFVHFTNPYWWRRWQLVWIATGGLRQMIEAIAMLRATDPDPEWCRRDRRQLRPVLEERAEQYWAAYHDFDFRFGMWWMVVALHALLWSLVVAVSLAAASIIYQGSFPLWMIAFATLALSIIAAVVYSGMADRTSKIRRELARAESA